MLKSIVIFSTSLVFLKYWYVFEMFLNCSWIFISNIAGHPVEAKTVQSQQRRYYKNTFDIILLFLSDFGQAFPCLAK